MHKMSVKRGTMGLNEAAKTALDFHTRMLSLGDPSGTTSATSPRR